MPEVVSTIPIVPDSEDDVRVVAYLIGHTTGEKVGAAHRTSRRSRHPQAEGILHDTLVAYPEHDRQKYVLASRVCCVGFIV